MITKIVYAGAATPIGTVELIDTMGDDRRIVDAARVSFDKSADQYTDKQNASLIRYLWREGHTSPFEQVVFAFRVRMPVAVARQWVRHRMGRLNEVSRRYVSSEPVVYTPEPRLAADNVKQGSSEDVDPQLYHSMHDAATAAVDEYNARIALGMAPEVARYALPQGTMTEWFWQMDLHNLFKFLRLRGSDHAQKEIAVFAEAIENILEEWGQIPYALKAFRQYNDVDTVVAELKRSTKFKSKPEELKKQLLELL